MYRDPATGVWEGPVPVIFNGQGYMCVSTDRGPVWVPSRAVKPALDHRDQPSEQQSGESLEKDQDNREGVT